MSRKTIRLELMNDNPDFRSYFYETLELPATTAEIRDVMQRIRISDGQLTSSQFSVYDCELIPELVGCRMDSPTIDEMNFLANRLTQLSKEEIDVMTAVISRFIKDDEEEIVSIKDLINMTYGLNKVSVISNVYNDETLGEFVIDNEIQSEVEAVPENVRHLLDKKKLGMIQREADGGVFVGSTYVVTGDFELPEVYDGITLPDTAPEQWYAFRLLISEAPTEDKPTDDTAEWISLPMSDSDMAAVAYRHNAKSLTDCVYYYFESSIPQITDEDFTTMNDIAKLNELGKRMAEMSPSEQITFKAALTAEKAHGATFDDILNISQNLHRYEMSANCINASQFFTEYLLTHMDTKFDAEWLNNAHFESEGRQLLSKLGASLTEYGVISAWGGSLYQLVPCCEQQSAEEADDSETEDEIDEEPFEQTM